MEIIAILLGFGLLAALVGFGEDDGGAAEPDGPTEGTEQEGTDGPDALTGSSGNDILSGLAGFDDIDGGAGDDTLFGGDGKDLLIGGAGDDIAYGGAWDDGLFGGAGDDFMRGDLGNDFLVGGDGDDELLGNGGTDELYGGDGVDGLDGGAGDDLLMASNLLNRDLTPEEYDQFRDGTIPRDEDGIPILTNFGFTGTDSDTSADVMFGGDGNDALLLGNNDQAFGGDGFNDFILGDWISEGNPATIGDFESSSDVIVVAVSDDNSDADVNFRTIAANRIAITINGVDVAIVSGTFDSLDGPDADIITTTYTPLA